jgi:phosphoribosylaminoimidazolecarboxamide formyltransferase/IMP cyclohydrolase
MPIARALLSVSDKSGLIPFAQFLASQGVELLSTGGTAKALREAGLAVKDVSEVTGSPEMMDGRVKTLHPKIHGGILADRGLASHLEALQVHQIGAIDMVVLNLYPFAETLASGADWDEVIENIDIGGPAMLRAAAKNHAYVTIVTDPADYDRVQEEMAANEGDTTLAFRRQLAQKAFATISGYDAAIAEWLNLESGIKNLEYPEQLHITATLANTLRYGENPHQSAALYVQNPVAGTLAGAKQLQGKELSYNNLNDTDAAWQLVNEFETPAVAIIKHANPCGVALGASCTEAFHKALACDPVSAYGGIIALNRPLTAEFVEALGKLFLEVIIAPEVTAEAAALLAKKQNLRVLESGEWRVASGQMIKPITGGFLVQSSDDKSITAADLQIASATQPSEAQIQDMLFAFRVAKHVKSNAIVIAKEGATIGIGAGQMSRVDSVRIACWKAAEAKLSTEGAVLASDAFFPFDDNVHRAAEAGIAALIQPGGSIRDDEVVKAADKHKMAMVLTGVRHFRH